MFTPTTKRRILLALPVAICFVAVLLAGCATPDVQCDMRVDYAWESPVIQQGLVLVRWQFNATLPPNVNGTTECYPGDPQFCLIRMKGPAASFHDTCGLAKQAHELNHSFGARHER